MLHNPNIFIVAGEASADNHAADLMDAMAQSHPEVRWLGMGGPKMRARGLHAWARAEEISVTGFTEVLCALPKIWRLQQRLRAQVAALRPAVAVLLDLPDFNLPLAKALHAMGIAVVYYIAPQAWAWRESRAQKMAHFVDQLLVILPFEEAFFKKHGVRARYVGHPLSAHAAMLPTQMPTLSLSQSQSQAQSQNPPKTLALLPGSRNNEISRHLAPMLDAFAILRQRDPTLRAIIPKADTVAQSLWDSIVAQHLSPSDAAVITWYPQDGPKALRDADAALVCSGTATLEATFARCPFATVYRLSWLSYQIMSRLMHVHAITLANLIAPPGSIEELIQDACTPKRLADAAWGLLRDDARREEILLHLDTVCQTLGQHAVSQNVVAALQPYFTAEPGLKQPSA